MKQHFTLKNNAVKFRLLTLTLLTLLIGGGMQAIGQQPFSLDYTDSADKTYYVTSTNEVASSANNTTVSGTQACKFYVSESSTSLTDDTKYDHFYQVHVNNASATVTFIFQTTKPVGFSNGSGGNQNAFKVTKGTLIMKLDKDHYDSDITLRRVGAFTTTSNTSCPFYLINDAGAASHQRLIIEGLDPKQEQLLYPVSNVKQDTATYLPGRQFVIDGAANITSVNMTDGSPTYTGISNKRPLFRIETGTLHLTNVTIQNSINSANDATHGGIYLMLNDNASERDRNLDVILTHCWLHNLVSTNFKTGYPGIGLQWQMRKANGSGSLVLKRSKFSSLSNNNGEDAAIRSTTGCKVDVTIDSCNINNNFGGGIRWQGLVAEPLQIKNTTIKGNYTKKSGGGIISKAPIKLTACKILNNTALKNGGGINYMCFEEPGMTVDEAGMIYPKNLELTMDAATEITGNKAETGNGGGIMIWGRLINLTRTGQMGYVYHEYDQDGNVVGPYQMKVNLNGATIRNNTAYNNGGGIFIYREAGTGTDPVSGEEVRDASCYLIDCQLSYGNIEGNKALKGNGGGVCISQTGTPNLTHVNADHPAQNIELTTGGKSADMILSENDAYLDGGGIYLYSINDGTGWNEDQKFQTIVTLKDRTKIKENTAYITVTTTSANDHGGGGLYVRQGDVNIAGTAAAGEANNPLIEENKTQYSGGGICLIKGNIFADYSRILSNEATTNQGRGGGVYLYEGTISFDYSKINTNTAKLHGGGIFCQGAGVNPKIDFINSEMKANQADQHGGGIYINDGTINITGSTIGGTSYADANLCGMGESVLFNGGGIFTLSGTVNIDDSNISYNLAARKGGGIYTQSGSVTIKNSLISYNQAGYRKNTSGDIIAAAGSSTGGGIHTDGGLVTINPNEDEATPTQIINNKARLNGGGIFTGSYEEGGVTTKGKVFVYGNRESEGGHLIDITYNEAMNGSGGGIFCYGDTVKDRYVLLRRVNLSNNKATTGNANQAEFPGVTSGCGGGLYLHDGLIDMNLCTVENNTAKLNGGGINNHNGNINVQSCQVRNNVAGFGQTSDAGSGGGIYTHEGTIGINYWSGAIQNEATRTEITGNTARMNGGGLNTHNGKIFVYGNSDDANQRILINNNTATKGSGGGIFCMGQPATGSTHTNFITIQHADLKLNKALEGNGNYNETVAGTTQTISKGCGGGIYLQLGEIKVTDIVMQNNLANVNGGAINNHDGFVDLYGCVIGGTDYYDGTTADGGGNKANQSGGGIYTDHGDIVVEDYIEHSHGTAKRYESKLNYNWAAENGGALNTHDGTIRVNKNERDDKIEITYNKAKKGGGIYADRGTILVYNTRIDNNTATENGGGVNNHAGDISLYGGELSNNTADQGHGGGAFTYVGDINIKPFPSSKTNPSIEDGTKVYNNIAKINGGGINNHTGRVDIRHASLRNNTATLGNGGGIFCEGPHSNATGFTIRMLYSELKENKTRGQNGTPTDPTGRGGGLYLKYGSIYAHNSEIIENFANINGGGLDNHDGSILVYGCNIMDNKALHGNGGGIYTQTGTITTGPSLYNGDPRSTVIQRNMAYINGGGINNHEGDIFLNGDHILENIAETGHGGGIYINSGTIEMAGGTIAKNETKLGNGGGVWSGGGKFHIHKREGRPIVEIIDVNITGKNSAKVHYHVIDEGHGSITSEGIYYGENKDEVEKATGATTNVHIISDGTLGTEADCYTIEITGLDEGKTYYTKSFATNDATPYPQTDFSEVVSFTTFDNKPTVISGIVANITKNSAQGSGKLLHSNNATQCGVVYIQKDGHLGSYDNLLITTTGAEKVSEDGTFYDDHFFTLDMTSLTPGKKYFARAYATNTDGTAYGDTVIFYTLKNVPDLNGNVVQVPAASITANQATFNFTIPASSSGEIKTYGFVWSTDDNPSLIEDHAKIWNDPIAPNTSKNINVTIDTLHGNTHYYVRAFASYEEFSSPVDPSFYALSVPTEFFTKDADGNPVTRAVRLSGITQTSVTFTGMVIDKGNPATITEYGVCYSTSPNPTIADSKASFTGDIDINTEYDNPITGLAINQTYYLRAYATNSSDKTGYSNEFTFTTLPMTIPHVFVSSVENITQTSAKVNCTVDKGGDDNVFNWGIFYSTNSDMSGATEVNRPGGGSYLTGNTFTASLTGLAKQTKYYVTAYATNSIGTHTTTNTVYFNTEYDKPEVAMDATTPIDDISYDANGTVGARNSATAHATTTPKGSPVNNIKTYGVCWGTIDDPKRMISDYTDSHYWETTGDWNAPQNIVHTWTQKYPNTKYYVKAYTSVNEPDGDNNLDDIVYSNPVVSFVTLPEMATGTCTDITNNSATLDGKIVSRDPQGNLVNGYYGVCWGTLPNPTISDNYVEEQITGSFPNPRSFSLTTTSLSPGTTYYYRAYYKSAAGDIAYANVGASTFTTKNFKLDIVNGSGGTVNKSAAYMDNGETCTVEATPDEGYHFDNWSYTGGGTGPILSSTTEPTTTFKMGNPGADATLTATFAINTYTITAGVFPSEGGTVTGAGTFNHGESCTLTATAQPGYTFVNWTKGGTEVWFDETYTFNVTETANYVANFSSKKSGDKGSNTTSYNTPRPRPRDIYPAPAREPWDWDDDPTLDIQGRLESTDTIAKRSNRDESPQDLPLIIENRATEGNGGGIYLARNYTDSLKLIFADGNINFNTAKLNGGGIYIDTTAFMHMYGQCEVNANTVPEGQKGGGIYLAGRLYIGETGNTGSDNGLRVNKNFASTNLDLNNNYKAIVAFSVINRDLAKASGYDVTTLENKKLGDNVSSGTGTILDKLLVLANAITSVDDIEATDISNVLGISESVLRDLTVKDYDDLKKNIYDEAFKALNNVYLPRDKYDYYDHMAEATCDDESNVIALLCDISGKMTVADANGVEFPRTKIGFSVPHGCCPVIATSEKVWGDYKNTQAPTALNPGGESPEYEEWLQKLMPNTGLTLLDCALFDDSDMYIAIHSRNNIFPFLGKYTYLWGSWPNPRVNEDPEIATGSINLMGRDDSHKHYQIDYITNPIPDTDDIAVWEIMSEEGLSWFTSYVNGLNVFRTGDANHKEYDPNVNPYAQAKLMCDVDMAEAFWVPIGSVTRYVGPSGMNGIYEDPDQHKFKGKFDGQGHIIKHLDCRFLTGIKKYGLFGELSEKAEVKNVFIDNSEFMTTNNTEGFYVGGMAGLMSGNSTIGASEARVNIDITYADPKFTYVGGLVGSVQNEGNVIHSSMAMPEITGVADYMGGLVGELSTESNLLNSFANPKFPNAKTFPYYPMNDDSYIGGLVGVNWGLVENCYSRLQGDVPTSDGTNEIFGWLAGSNEVTYSPTEPGGILHSYIPSGKSPYVKKETEAPIGHGQYGPTTLVSGKYGFMHRDQQMFDKDGTSIDDNKYQTTNYSDYLQYKTTNDTLIVGGLTQALNAWVEANNTTEKTYHPWMRTMASLINDDYPIPNFLAYKKPSDKSLSEDPLYNAVGSKDGVFMEYKNDVNDLLAEYSTLQPAEYPSPQVYLYDANTEPDGTTPKDITESNKDPEVLLIIHEDVGIKVRGDAAEDGLFARVGITFDNSNGSVELGGKNYDWHMFSSALNNETPIGIIYRSDNTNSSAGGKTYPIFNEYASLKANGIPETNYNNRDYMDPPVIEWDLEKFGYFPTNTPYGQWGNSGHWPSSGPFSNTAENNYSFDLYSYQEANRHWINFKREGKAGFHDHWHQDIDGSGKHQNLEYTNETHFLLGKGYMMGVSAPSMLMADGELNTGKKESEESLTSLAYMFNLSGYSEDLRGVNLVGNPYQSYLNFNLFAHGDSETNNNSPNSGKIEGNSYYVFDADKGGYLTYTAYASENPDISAPGYIHPHQGFFVRIPTGTTCKLEFTDAMREAGKGLSNFRSHSTNYPLVNLLCYDSEGKRDVTTVEINRPEPGGGHKMKGMRIGKKLIYARWEGVDYQTAFLPEGVTEVPVRFEPFEDDVYTMKWSTLHGDFSYLHLIDNLTGADIDMLNGKEYRFEGRTSDYYSRFKIVFNVTGVEEYDDQQDTSKTFAFQMGDELIVTGAGILQMFDLNGHCLLSSNATGEQCSVKLPKVASGMYLLRLTDTKQTKVQKIIIK